MSQELVKSNPFKRSWRNFLINPRYQFKYIFFLGSCALTLTFLYSALTYYYVRENYAVLIDLSPMTDEARNQLYQELNTLIQKIGGTSVVFILFVSFFGIVLSHRTAGALFHFKKVFAQVRDGKLSTRVRLRPKDDFQDVAQVFNEMMDAVEKSAEKKSKPEQK